MRREPFFFAIRSMPGNRAQIGRSGHLCGPCVAGLDHPSGARIRRTRREANMAWLYQDPQSKRFKVCFRYGGRTYKKSLKTRKQREADAVLGGVERTLLQIEQQRLVVPEGADVVTFVLSDGRETRKPQPREDVPTTKKGLPFRQLVER